MQRALQHPAAFRIAAFCCYIALSVLFLEQGWRKWLDPVIDFGREMYLPWQITQGKTLYTDLVHNYGPLSPYINALWFKVFGVSLSTLIWCNLAIYGCFLVLLHAMVRTMGGRWAAFSGCLLFVAVFSFNQYSQVGNYNYVTPYAHEATHGTLLCLGALSLLYHYAKNSSRLMLAGAGVCLGLVFLTKHELFIACVGGVGVFWVVQWLRRGEGVFWRDIALFCGAAVAPSLLAVLALSLAGSPGAVLDGMLFPWRMLLKDDVLSLKFYQQSMGLLHAGENVRTMLVWSGYYVGVLLVGGAVDWFTARRPWLNISVAVVIFLGVTWRLATLSQGDAAAMGTNILSPMPLALLVLGAGVMVRAWLRRKEGIEAREALIAGMLAYSFLLLSKMYLRTRFFHYGFFLAMPGTLMLCAAYFGWAPGFLRGKGRRGYVLIGAVAGVLTALGAVCFSIAGHNYAAKTAPVADGGDRFYTDHRGLSLNTALDALSAMAPPGSTLMTLPEGALLNYLSRMESSIPYYSFLPSDMLFYGEEEILGAMQEAPPDFAVFLYRDTREFGHGFFGGGYAQKIGSWLQEQYVLMHSAGPSPLNPNFNGPPGYLLLTHPQDRVIQHRVR